MKFDPKAPVPAECPTCFRERFLTDDGECAGCVVEAQREEELRQRREAEAYDRKVLGYRPFAKSMAFTRIAVTAALYWSGWATKVATPTDLTELERIREHLAMARRRLERIPR